MATTLVFPPGQTHPQTKLGPIVPKQLRLGAVQATPESPSAIQVTWPGGRRTEQAIDKPNGEVRIKL